jgi:peptidoglycan/xylan/chitin deacetylase (PgdA/CDA1 family)
MKTIDRIQNKLALLDQRNVVKLRLKAPVASFTFDDFPRSAYEAGGRILEAAGGRATYFVSGSFMGQSLDGVQYYDEATLKAAHRAGHEIGCHTFSHQRLGCRGAAFARQDCQRNAEFVSGVLGPDMMMSSFAYPYGDVSISVKSAMSQRFALCRGVHPYLPPHTEDLAQLSIISLETYHASALDLPRLIASAKANNSWMIFLTHDVSDNPTPCGSTPAAIEHTADALVRAGIRIVPLKTAAALALHTCG